MLFCMHMSNINVICSYCYLAGLSLKGYLNSQHIFTKETKKRISSYTVTRYVVQKSSEKSIALCQEMISKAQSLKCCRIE